MSPDFALGFLACAVSVGIVGLVWAAIADGLAIYRLITRNWPR